VGPRGIGAQRVREIARRDDEAPRVVEDRIELDALLGGEPDEQATRIAPAPAGDRRQPALEGAEVREVTRAVHVRVVVVRVEHLAALGARTIAAQPELVLVAPAADRDPRAECVRDRGILVCLGIVLGAMGDRGRRGQQEVERDAMSKPRRRVEDGQVVGEAVGQLEARGRRDPRERMRDLIDQLVIRDRLGPAERRASRAHHAPPGRDVHHAPRWT
jgi:hypothetical protein